MQYAPTNKGGYLAIEPLTAYFELRKQAESMKIGVMNNPMHDLLREIQWIGEHKFDFVDMTLEPPALKRLT